jgi:SAM-dependent methyltransferase
LAEFTGERVIPGEVDVDLWNEHYSRYLFAARLCRNKRVVEIGCGTGYGSAEIANTAQSVTAIDVAPDAVAYAATHYDRPNLRFLCASGTNLPLAEDSADLILAFEIIEHLDDWMALLSEAQRVLNPFGQFVVSTPNKEFYAESRRNSGPNPYHVHEFGFEEFRQELRARFPHVSLFVQNHAAGIVFQPVETATGAQVRLDSTAAEPGKSNFFVAVCASTPQTGAPSFVHIPSSANVLRERSQHIIKLEDELTTKNEWLATVKAEHKELVDRFRTLKTELEERNTWADELDRELEEARRRIDSLHAEKDAEIAEISAGYEEKVGKLEHECESQSRWAMETQQKLDSKIQELKQAVDALHETEKTVEERTAWAKQLDAEVEALRGKVSIVEASRWVRFGKAIGIGPGSRLK